MGMFDHVTCELPMPDGRAVVKDSFQTKSLSCCMDLYTTTSTGRLIFHKQRKGCITVPDTFDLSAFLLQLKETGEPVVLTINWIDARRLEMKWLDFV